VALPQSETVAPVNLLLAIARRWIPGPVKHRAIDGLYTLTANAFGLETPRTRHMSLAERIDTFARFSHMCVQKNMEDGTNSAPVKRALYRRAKLLAGELRSVFNPSSRTEYLELLGILYDVIGITIKTEESGRICVTSCSFSLRYSPETCRLMSAVDDGFAVGLWGCGRLTFQQRITEGHSCCEARFDFGDAE